MANENSKSKLWLSYAMSGVPALMLFASAGMKFVQPPEFETGIAHLGWTISQATGLGILEIACTLIYLFPRTSVLGAILLAGYLGGATAAHVRVGDPFFAPPVLGILLWGGLYLRDARLRALLPIKQ